MLVLKYMFCFRWVAQMRKRSVRKSLVLVCMLTASLSTPQLLADWSGNSSGRAYNQGYGDFPPADIEQQIFRQQEASEMAARELPVAEEYTATTPNNQLSDQNQAQQYSPPYSQQPAYGSYNGGRSYAPYGNQGYYPSSGFNGPWNNNSSGFSNPWNGNGSNFSGPWNNNGSSISGPWDNNGSSFSGPWDNNGSNFSMPWGNNGSGFSPFGNDSGRNW